MDLDEFAKPNFDPKTWIDNMTKDIIDKGEEREKSVMSLIAKLQVQFHRLNGDFESTARDVIHHLPKINKDAGKLSEDAGDLQDKMNAVRDEIDKIKKNTDMTISSLEKIDRVKMELMKYKEALHEADKWTMLSNDIKAALDVRDIDTVTSKVLTMQQSLSILSNAHDYEDKKLELESFKNQLEAMASPLLLQAFTSKSIEQSKKYVETFKNINRLPQLLKLYSQNQKSLLIQAWEIMSDVDSDENVVESFRNYYNTLYSTWIEQIKWFDCVFSEKTGVDVLLELFRDLCQALSPKFIKHMDNSLKQVSEPLILLMDLKTCAQQFANNLKSAIGTLSNNSNIDKVKSLGKAIYLPYKNHISKYGVYQEAALHPHLDSLNVLTDDIMESVQNLGSQNSKAFSYLDDANNLCVNLTESCGYPGYLKVAENFLNSYLNQYRLIKRKINESQQKNYEEVNMFQMCLNILQYLGNFLNRVKQLDQECMSNLTKVKTEYSKPDVHPFYNYPELLLDETKRGEFDNVLRNLSETNQLNEFKSVFDNVRDLCRDVYDASYKIMFEPILTILNSLGTSMSDVKKGTTTSTSDLPDYSFVPQEYITQIGQYLMNMPQLLDPFSLSKNLELALALSLVGSYYSELLDSTTTDENSFAELFLSQISKGTCKAYAKQILAIQKLSNFASKQLATDINYLGNVLEDMGFNLTKKLQDIAILLKVSPSEFNGKCTDCSPQIVAEVRQMRNLNT